MLSSELQWVGVQSVQLHLLSCKLCDRDDVELKEAAVWSGGSGGPFSHCKAGLERGERRRFCMCVCDARNQHVHLVSVNMIICFVCHYVC